MSNVLIIAGMHRSGTSLITQWLKRCGLFVGDELAGPEIGNSDGLFEDQDFQKIHKQFLRARNCSPIGFEFEPISPLVEAEKKQLQHVIDKKQSMHDQWGWKDPITCLFLDAYRELIPSARYVIIVRDFRSSVSSLVMREHKVDMKRFRSKKGLSRLKWRLFKQKKIKRPFELYAERFLKVWILYHEIILEHVKNLSENRYVFVHYSQLIENDSMLFNHIRDSWNFSLNYLPFSDVYKKDLLSDVASIEKHISDKYLVQRARTLEAKFQELLRQQPLGD